MFIGVRMGMVRATIRPPPPGAVGGQQLARDPCRDGGVDGQHVPVEGAPGGGGHVDEQLDLGVAELVQAAGHDRLDLGARVLAHGAAERDQFVARGVPGGDRPAVAVRVGGGLGGGQAPGALRHGLLQQRDHGVELGGRRGAADGVGAHHVAPQRAVADHEAGVDGGAAVEGVEVVAEGGPAPGDALFQRGQGHALDPAHHPAGVVGVVGPGGVERRQGEAAVAAGDGGDAVAHGGGGVGVPEELGVVVGVRVHEAGGEHQAGGVLGRGGGLVAGPGRGDDGDAAAADAHVGGPGGGAGAVHQRGARDQVVEHGPSGGGAAASARPGGSGWCGAPDRCRSWG
jgi:hypothetical protein